MWFKKRSSSFVAPYMALFNMNALSVAMNAEQDVAVRALKLQLEKTQLALERARMSMEDARAAGSARDVFRNVIEPAQELLLDARREMRRAFDDPNCNYKVALISAYNDVIDVEDCLKANAVSSESASESES